MLSSLFSNQSKSIKNACRTVAFPSLSEASDTSEVLGRRTGSPAKISMQPCLVWLLASVMGLKQGVESSSGQFARQYTLANDISSYTVPLCQECLRKCTSRWPEFIASF